MIHGLPWSIEDKPRFPHRGLMMDTARHFQPIESILRMIDSLPYGALLLKMCFDSAALYSQTECAPLAHE